MAAGAARADGGQSGGDTGRADRGVVRLRPVDTRPPGHNLPEQLSSFVGRESEIVDLIGLLPEKRLITLTGPGGVGKSRLALRLAADHLPGEADGVWLVDLAGLTEPDLVPPAMASTLGVVETPGRSVVEALTASLRARGPLLLVDNCEHLLAAIAGLLEHLLRECPRLHVVATSREPLAISGELVWTVPPLAVPSLDADRSPEQMTRSEAVRLFIERAGAVRPGYLLSEANMTSVAQICRRLDGIPLALELAAARLRGLSAREIADRLDDRFGLLTRGTRTALPRHRTLRALVDWSHDLLSERERTLLRRLAVFAGGWTLASAELVCPDNERGENDVLELLTSLVDRSLVIMDDWRGSARYRFLDTIRSYALEKLRAAGEEARLRQRHQEWCMALLAEANRPLWGPDQATWFARLDAEIDNIRAALEWSSLEPERAEVALRAGTTLWRFWDVRGHQGEAIRWFSTLLRVVGPDGESVGRARGEIFLTWLVLFTADVPSIDERASRCVAMASHLDDPETLIWSLWTQVMAQTMVGKLDGATATVEQALDVAERTRHPFGRAPWTYWLGELERLRGNLDRAEALLSESLRDTAALGNVRDLAFVEFGLALVALERGDYVRAERFFREALGRRRALGDIPTYAMSVDSLAWTAAAAGKGERAARLLGATSALHERLGSAVLPLWRAHHARAEAEARAALGDRAYETAFAGGRAGSVEQTLDEALGDHVAPKGGRGQAHDAVSPLTQREREVAVLIASGRTNRQIAKALIVSHRTVDSHVSNMLAKLSLVTRAQLAVWATEHGLHTQPAT